MPWGLCATAGALILAAAPADAATGAVLYVDRASSACLNTGPGTSDQPFCTIGAAAAKVTPGQTVQVAAGSYPEAVTVPRSGTTTAPITFTTTPGATVTLSGQANGFVISGRSWVTVTGFDVTRTSSYGISVTDSSHITLSRNHVSYSGQPVSGLTRSGVRLSNVSDSAISGNTVDHNTNYGINLSSSSTRNTVTANESFSNAQGYQRAASGIRFYSSPGNTVIANVCHNNEDSGMEFDAGSSNNLVVNNVIYNNGDHGIDDTGNSPNNSVIGNSVYNSVTAGIDFEGGATGSVIFNNIAVDNGINSPRTKGNIRVDSTSTMGTTMDYNIVYLSAPGRNYEWGIGYDTLARMQLASGQEAHSTQADPKWNSPSAADFTLQPGSPAIDSADSAIAGAAATDAIATARIDDPMSANTGVGPRTYDDRGPYEYTPQNHTPDSVTSSPTGVLRPPLASTTIKKTQHAVKQRGLIVKVTSNLAGAVTVTGTIALRKGIAKTLRFKRVTRSLAASKTRTLKLRLSKKQFATLKGVLVGKRRLKAQLTLVVKDTNGGRTVKKATVTLER